MDQLIVRKLTQLIEANLENEKFGVDELAVAAGMSRSTIHRRLRRCINKSASQFIREVRLERALAMLEQEVGTASEVSYKVGFNSPTYFNHCFHQYYGFPPGEIKRRMVAHTSADRTLSDLPGETSPLGLKAQWPMFQRTIPMNRTILWITVIVLVILTTWTCFLLLANGNSKVLLH